MLDRDGYGLLVDVLREPGLRQRSRAYLRARLGGKAGGEGAVPRAVRVYALMGLAWMVLGALFILVMVSRYYDLLVAISGSEAIVRGLFVGLTLMLFAPVFLVLGRGLLDRRQREPVDADA